MRSRINWITRGFDSETSFDTFIIIYVVHSIKCSSKFHTFFSMKIEVAFVYAKHTTFPFYQRDVYFKVDDLDTFNLESKTKINRQQSWKQKFITAVFFFSFLVFLDYFTQLMRCYYTRNLIVRRTNFWQLFTNPNIFYEISAPDFSFV